MVTAQAPAERSAIPALHLPPCFGVARVEPADDFEITDELLRDLHDEHPGLLFEVSLRGELVITMSAGGGSSEIGGDCYVQTWNWDYAGPHGVVRESSGGYEPIPGVKYAPDVSWVSRERADSVGPRDQRPDYWPIAPEFVIEVQSPSDRRSQQEEKLEHWIQLGVSVGLLVDPFQQQVLIYRPDAEPEIRNRPDRLEIGPELPGLALDFTRIWAG